MADGLMLVMGDDGVFREYKDDYDLIIHFESKEEQDAFIKQVESSIPREKVLEFIRHIQEIKDNYNEKGEPINYGTICGILIEGWRLVEKRRKP